MAKSGVLTNFLIIFFIFLNCCCIEQLRGQQPPQQYQVPHKRFEYKYSFKGPYLAQKDGTVPFWEYVGNAIASEEMVCVQWTNKFLDNLHFDRFLTKVALFKIFLSNIFRYA